MPFIVLSRNGDPLFQIFGVLNFMKTVTLPTRITGYHDQSNFTEIRELKPNKTKFQRKGEEEDGRQWPCYMMVSDPEATLELSDQWVH